MRMPKLRCVSIYETFSVSSKESWRGQFANIAITSMYIGMQQIKRATGTVYV